MVYKSKMRAAYSFRQGIVEDSAFLTLISQIPQDFFQLEVWKTNKSKSSGLLAHHTPEKIISS